MLLTLTTTAPAATGPPSGGPSATGHPVTAAPATDLGFLLHKHPDRAQRFDTAAGGAYVFYPEATAARCTAALLLDVDPVGLVRGKGNSRATTAAQYVDDRPYAASSLLAVAMAAVFSTAMAGICKSRPELAATPLPLEIRVPALPCRRGGAALAERLFAPLGWRVDAVTAPLDPAFPEWGDAPHHDVTFTGTVRLADALTQLYVLLPVLDDGKHYYVGRDEIDKLVREGASWLPGHPERHLIARRYLAHRAGLASAALAQLGTVEDVPVDAVSAGFEPGLVAVDQDPDADLTPDDPAAPGAAATGDQAAPEPGPDAPAEAASPVAERAAETPEPSRPPSLAVQRRRAIMDVLRAADARRVADLGCGDGKLVGELLADARFTEVVAVDVSHRALETAARRLRIDRMPERVQARLRLVASSLTYRDARIAGLDAAVLCEVIEHVDPPRLPALAAAVLGEARPRLVVITTPNVEFNVRYEGLAPGAPRHRDHRFEWTRAEFAAWVEDLLTRYPYTARLGGIGTADPALGTPTQLAVLERVA
ncbi:3' terminal RNA ribose 2'-O-methyltransferase Hen1 [Pseudofrankia inefficax]|uniref:Small RNA 2'-O-methyltransferase n=1 Tax=Pseudofrankia inefficax (strain DSM 45817 / CECT 9037 / DDB 130130 / EuI1c) TaxID=298654 RepID=E3JBD0_PSEI1|nr:3' terminal RNA ribose 2'-O-methyltransferase Hen1 [Pseudofrankia inefficax]ADP78660.1 Methyltransferase type 12 [Pseudofrankia inefficax]